MQQSLASDKSRGHTGGKAKYGFTQKAVKKLVREAALLQQYNNNGEAIDARQVVKQLLSRFRVMSNEAISLNAVLAEFNDFILPGCVMPFSSRFVAYPYSGDSIPALVGSFLATCLQQNLVDFETSPAATATEAAVIGWLRQALGYRQGKVTSIAGVGGIVTSSGTMCNCAALLIAKNRVQHQLGRQKRVKILVPEELYHYGFRAATKWLGGLELQLISSTNRGYDLDALRSYLHANSKEVLMVVGFAGNSRTFMIDALKKISEIVRSIDSDIWLHCDAAHGFQMVFYQPSVLKGIESFDSVTADAHKSFGVPFGTSFLLLKSIRSAKFLSSDGKLRSNDFSFGRITPFQSSRGWLCLPVWFHIRSRGVRGLCSDLQNRFALRDQLIIRLSEIENVYNIEPPHLPAVIFFCRAKAKRVVAGDDNKTQEMAEHLRKKWAITTVRVRYANGVRLPRKTLSIRVIVASRRFDHAALVEFVSDVRLFSKENSDE